MVDDSYQQAAQVNIQEKFDDYMNQLRVENMDYKAGGVVAMQSTPNDESTPNTSEATYILLYNAPVKSK